MVTCETLKASQNNFLTKSASNEDSRLDGSQTHFLVTFDCIKTFDCKKIATVFWQLSVEEFSAENIYGAWKSKNS